MSEISSEELNYEQDTSIDPDALDVEWLRQPDLMRRYATHVANAKLEMEETKERLDVGKARIERDIRANPQTYGIQKLTESAVQSTILLQREYQELSKEYISARYEYDVATAVVRAIDQRKTALENLVRLLIASYFAGPQAPRDLSGEWAKQAVQKNSNAKVKIRQRRS